VRGETGEPEIEEENLPPVQRHYNSNQE